MPDYSFHEQKAAAFSAVAKLIDSLSKDNIHREKLMPKDPFPIKVARYSTATQLFEILARCPDHKIAALCLANYRLRFPGALFKIF